MKEISCKVIFYRTEDGHEPALEFLNDLDARGLAAFLVSAEQLEQKYLSLRPPYVHGLGDYPGIHEMRLASADSRICIFRYFVYNSTAVFTSGQFRQDAFSPDRDLNRCSSFKRRSRRLKNRWKGTTNPAGTDFSSFDKKMLADPLVFSQYQSVKLQYDLAETFREARKKAGLTAAELAKKSGVQRTFIASVENAVGNPSVQTLYKLASAMGMSLDIHLKEKS